MGLEGRRSGANWVRQPIREDLQELANEWRDKMIELAVEMDDAAMEAYLEGNEPDEATLRKLIRKGCLSMSFFPMLAGSAFKNKGVQPLLNAVIDYLAGADRRADPDGLCPDDETEERNIARNADDADVLGAGVQDHERPLRWFADLHAHLFGRAEEGATR